MRKDSPLARKESIQPQDLWDKPLIVSHQKGDDVFLNQWLQRDESQLHIAATYNLILNTSLFIDEGLGYALCYEKLINTNGSNLCFVLSFLNWKLVDILYGKNTRFCLKLQKFSYNIFVRF